MKLKCVFIFAACLLNVANLAYAQPGLIDGVLQMPITGGDGSGGNPYVAGATVDMSDNAGHISLVQTLLAPATTWTSVANNTTAVKQWITTGYNGGLWTGSGIQSTYETTYYTSGARFPVL